MVSFAVHEDHLYFYGDKAVCKALLKRTQISQHAANEGLETLDQCH